ncbi:LOW QUALITY PROTEIN: uncharacterized protein PAF06_001264 [Gastrophryne carolinensis]
MSEPESAPAAPPAAETPAKKKRQQPKKAGAAKKSGSKSSGPSVSELLLKAVSACKERSGASLPALKKALSAANYDVDKNNSRVKLALKALVTKGSLVQVKGTGASGSFKINKQQLNQADKKKAAKKKSPAKKLASAAKSPKKPKKAPSAAKSPKKAPAKKPAAAKKPKAAAAKPKKAASPAKKAAKPKAAKSPAKKAAKPKVVKSPAKKVAKPKKAAPKKKCFITFLFFPLLNHSISIYAPSISLLMLGVALGLLGQQHGLDVGQDAALGDSDPTEQLVELLVVAHCQLQVSGDDAGLLVVPGSVAGQLENLSSQVLEHGSQVDGSSGAHPLGIVALPEQTVDTANGELETGPGGAAMSEPESAPAAPPAAETPAKKKRQQPKKAGAAKKSGSKSSGPSVSELLLKAVSACKERSGASLPALKKALSAANYDVDKNNSRVKLALKALVTKGSLVQVKGTGASGSFKINKQQLNQADKKKATKKKSPAKKPASAAKSPKKPKKAPSAAKSPKKAPAKKPAAAKKPKAAAAKPKKAAKSPAKKAAKPKVVKSPAKKAAKPKVVKSPAKKVAKPKKAAPKKK